MLGILELRAPRAGEITLEVERPALLPAMERLELRGSLIDDAHISSCLTGTPPGRTRDIRRRRGNGLGSAATLPHDQKTAPKCLDAPRRGSPFQSARAWRYARPRHDR